MAILPPLKKTVKTIRKRIVAYGLTLSAFVLTIACTWVDDPLELLLAELGRISKLHSQEKVHLHFDKPYYAAGDRIWFKAYVLDEHTLAPTERSKVLYVELIHRDIAIQSLKLPLENGLAWGNLNLPDSIPEGTYRLRAYTQWMRNAGEDYFFEQNVFIGNTKQSGVLMQSKFQAGSKADTGSIIATLSFMDVTGQVLAEKSVDLSLQFLGNSLKLPNGKTDQNGNISLIFRRPKARTGDLVLAATIHVGPQKPITKFAIVDYPEGAEVLFFPEGGQLLKGVPNRIAIQAIHANGLGEPVQGTITSTGEEALSFTTNENGLGSVVIVPQTTEAPSAKILFKNGTSRNYRFPAVMESGYALMMRGQATAQVYISPDLLNKGVLSLVGQRNGNVFFVKQIPTAKPLASLTIPVTSLPAGLLQLTLFDPNGVAVSERFTFINHDKNDVKFTVNGLKPSYDKRSLVEFSISANQLQAGAGPSFSVSVTNSSIVVPRLDHESNIFTTFRLSSDSKGGRVRDNHLLEQRNLNELDLAVLTNKWRNIPWTVASARKIQPSTFTAEESLSVSGTLTLKGKPLPNGKITLMKSNWGFEMLTATSDSDGKFRFDGLSFADSTKLLLQVRTNTADKKNIKILIDQFPGQKITARDLRLPNLEIQSILKKYIEQNQGFLDDRGRSTLGKDINQLNTVEITARTEKSSQNVIRYGHPDQRFTAKDFDSAAFLSQVLAGKVRGNFRTYRVLLDGVFVGATGFFTRADPATIESIDVLSSPHLIGGHGPIMVVTSKKYPNFSHISYGEGMITLTPRGFNFAEAFLAPDYGRDVGQRPDLRSTVYWNPNIELDGDGRLKIRYFNPDSPGRYRIVIEGIDGVGGLGRTEFYYEVR